MKNTYQLKGFTLIELVIVIVILGILSAVALPKFIDIQSEAKASALAALSGAIKEAVSLQHSIAVVNEADGGLENGYISDGILFDQGYPVALDFDVPFGSFNQDNDPDNIPEILEAVNFNLNEWTTAEVINGSEGSDVTRELYITRSDVLADGASASDITATNCYISYDSYLLIQEPPVIRLVTTGC